MIRALLSNRHTVWALSVATIVFGVLAYFRLPMTLFPDTAPPLVNVVTAWPGAAGTDVGEDLSRVLEEELASLEGVARVKSTSQDNLSVVTVEFQFDREAELAAVDVQNAIARIRGRLPGGIAEPQVLRFDTSDRPILTVGVAGKDRVHARRLAEDVFARELQRIPGVAAVDVFGGSVPAVLVDVDPRALDAHRIPLERVAGALRTHNAAAPAGRVRGQESWTMLRVDPRVTDAAALAHIPIGLPDGSRVLVGDLGQVTRGAFDDDARFSINGEPAIALQIFKTQDANTVDVVHMVLERVDALGASHPELQILRGEESATFTELVVRTLMESIWQALLLAAAVIFLFLGHVRASLVAIVSMPMAYLLTFALMRWAGVELNLVTLTAAILAVGMVVDASVVVLENIIRLRDEEGMPIEEAAVKGTSEVLIPVLAGVGTTLIVLVPLLALEGFIGRIFWPLATTLILAFVSSVVVALVLVPVLTPYASGERRLDRIGLAVARPFLHLMDRVRDLYVGLTRLALRWRMVTVVLALLSFVGGALGMRAAGAEVLPRMDSGSFFISLETPSGTSLEQTARAVAAVEQVVRQQPEVVTVQSQAGFEPGMRFFGGGGVLGPTQGFVGVTLTPRNQRQRSVWEIEREVRDKVAQVPGLASVVVREIGQSARATTTAPIDVRISGNDPLVLDRLADEVLARLARVPNVVEPGRSWRRDHQRARVEVDALRAAQLGLTPTDVAQRLAMGSEGVPAGEFRGEGGSSEPVRVRFAPSSHPSTADLLGWPLFAGGEAIPVRSLVDVRPTSDQGLITRDDLAHTVNVTGWVDGRPLSFVTAEVGAALRELVVPEGYEVALKGEQDDLIDARGQLVGALLVSILAVYLLLVAQFRSFLHPITVMMAIPLSISGVAAALHLAGKAVSMPVMVGMVLLVGTVVNSSILLVHVVRELREKGMPRQEALLQGVSQRFRPIMMTSLSTVVGMIPLAAEWALGAERLSPLATAAIGGMLTATLLTIVVIPVLYDLAEDLVAGLGRLVRRPSAAVAVVLAVVAGASEVQAEPLRLDLEAAVKLAEAYSPALRSGEDRVEASKERLGSAKAKALPALNLNLRYSRMSWVEPGTLSLPFQLPNQPPPEPIALGEALENHYSARVTLQQPLFTGGALLHGLRAGQHGVEYAEASLDRDAADLRLQVAEAWLGWVAAKEMSEVARRSEEALSAHLAQLERLVAAGRATELDAARVRARRAEVGASRVEAEGAAASARIALATLLGLEADADLEPVVPDAPPAADLEATADGSGRPELAVARAGAQVAEEKAHLAAAGMWPQVALRAGFQYENPNTRYFPIRDEWNESWDASVVLSWNFWDWGATFRDARAARHEASAARRTVAALQDRTRVELARAAQQVRTADARLAAAALSVSASEAALDAARRLFEAGRATSLELVDREAELTGARAGQVRARVETQRSREALRRLTGG